MIVDKKIRKKLEKFYCVPADLPETVIWNIKSNVLWIPEEDRDTKVRPLNDKEWAFVLSRADELH